MKKTFCLRCWLSICISGGLLLAACSNIPVSSVTPDPDAGNRVIFSAEQAAGLWSDPGQPADGFWTPDQEQILALEAALPTYLQANPQRFTSLPPAWERLDQYRRQYFGLQRGQEKTIYANYFCSDLGIDWQKQIVSVEDGGDCYFQFQYDPKTGAFSSLIVNGDA